MERVSVTCVVAAVGVLLAGLAPVASRARTTATRSASTATKTASPKLPSPKSGMASPKSAASKPGSAMGKTGTAAKGEPAARDAGEADATRSGAAGAGRATVKTRQGSVLKSDKLLPAPVDLRSEAERRRDAELRTHFSRLAELDVIAAVAADSKDVALQEDVEEVRRKEVQRHQKTMMALKRATLRASALASGAEP
jgi:hypothetical protein